MGVLSGVGRWFGGVLLFFGLASFITLYALSASGVLSSTYAANTISTIVNYSISGNSLSGSSLPGINSTSNLNMSQLKQYIQSVLSKNPNCNIFCLATQKLSNSSSVNFPLTTSNIKDFQLVAGIAAAIGAVLVFLLYKGKDRFTALGRNVLSVSILSFVSVYIPLVYIIPYFFAVKVSSFTIRIPESVFAPFTSLVLTMDIIFGVIGAVLLVLGVVIYRNKAGLRQASPPKQ